MCKCYRKKVLSLGVTYYFNSRKHFNSLLLWVSTKQGYHLETTSSAVTKIVCVLSVAYSFTPSVKPDNEKR